MPREKLANNVFEAAINRLVEVYEQGHRLVVSFSAGKDSTCVLECCIMAARLTGNLPVDVVMRDEEIMVPGTFEYAERVANRSDVRVTWLIANQPVINCFNREEPYFWVFDPLLKPEQWVRPPPPWATYIKDNNIEKMTTLERFPPPTGRKLYSVLGIRTQESRGRMYGLFSAKGHMIGGSKVSIPKVWPIYDWADGDVWRALKEFGWDYNRAYDTLRRLGVPPKFLRIAPPTMNAAGSVVLRAAAHGWPRWFDRVCQRLPGVRAVTLFGKRAVEPSRKLDESWEECFQRQCVDDAPGWIRERAMAVREKMLSAHAHHSTAPFPEVAPCHTCKSNLGSWEQLTKAMFLGEAFCSKIDNLLPQVEPEFFRPGAGTWGGGKASF